MDPAPLEVGLDAFPFHIHWDVFGFVAALLIFSGAVHAEIRPEFDDGGLYFQTASGIAMA